MKSIIQKSKECFVCRTVYGLHDHHIFYGTSNRKLSEEYGLKVWLCGADHNLSNRGVHFNKELDIKLKHIAQRKFEETHTREEFRTIFGKSWL